jgi:predicted dithiol-disulfide oxidoreductase (DUF899 family)
MSLSRVFAGVGNARFDRLCHLRRDVMRKLGKLLVLRGQSTELDARMRLRTLDHVQHRLCGGQVLGKIEGGDDIPVRDLHHPSPIVHYALGRSRLRAHEHAHRLKGKVSLLDLFEGRRQLIVYRAFFEAGVFGWPEHACRGCSLGADQVAHLAHLNARNTTLAYASRAPQADIARLKARMGWEMPWYTILDSFDADFGVDAWHGHNVFFRDRDRVFRTYFVNSRGDEAMGTTWSFLDITPLGRQESWEDSPEGYPQTPPYKWWNWHDNYDGEASPDPKWVEVSEAGEAAFRKRDSDAKA